MTIEVFKYNLDFPLLLFIVGYFSFNLVYFRILKYNNNGYYSSKKTGHTANGFRMANEFLKLKTKTLKEIKTVKHNSLWFNTKRQINLARKFSYQTNMYAQVNTLFSIQYCLFNFKKWWITTCIQLFLSSYMITYIVLSFIFPGNYYLYITLGGYFLAVIICSLIELPIYKKTKQEVIEFLKLTFPNADLNEMIKSLGYNDFNPWARNFFAFSLTCQSLWGFV